MRKMWDFRCTGCDDVKELLVRNDDPAPSCTKCGAETKRMLAAPRCKLEGISGDFPGAAIKWARDHERAAKQAAKRNPEADA